MESSRDRYLGSIAISFASSLIPHNRFPSAIDMNPEYAQAHVNRGTVKTSLGEYKSAVGDFTKAVFINPKKALAFMSRGTAYMTNFKETEKACADWKTACEL